MNWWTVVAAYGSLSYGKKHIDDGGDLLILEGRAVVVIRLQMVVSVCKRMVAYIFSFCPIREIKENKIQPS